MSGLGDLECGESLLGDGRGGTTIRNLGFEVGAYGRASSWESGSETQTGTFAPFGMEAAETFERGWANRPYAFTLPAVVAARFSSAIYVVAPSFEDFERGWANFPFFTSTFSAITCEFTGALDAEAFEAGWGNDAYLLTFAGGLTAAVFGGNPFDGFEAGWDNDAYLFTFGGGDTTAMVISGQRAQTVEDFEHVQGSQLYSADPATDRIATVAHGLGVNYRVIFDSPIAGAMPTPIAPTVPYYVQAVADADHFAIALVASAGAAIDITSAGSGLLRWSAPYENWTSRMATI